MEQEECAEVGDDPGPTRVLQLRRVVNHHAEVGVKQRDEGPKVDPTSKPFRSEPEL